MALPIDFTARYGSGTRRGLVLGGGGIFFVAWQVSYLNTLARAGVNLAGADRVVGTSAGSIIAGIYTGRRIGRFARIVELLARAPGLVGAMAPAGNLTPSQSRALDLFRDADNAEPDTVRAIGRAALAADAAPAANMRRTAMLMIGRRRFPADSLRITTVDAYSGERLVIDHRADVPIPVAAAASGTVPGLFSPQLIHDHYCMDGGVSGSGIHTDLVAGTERAVVVSLSEAFRDLGPRPGGLTQRPGAYLAELQALADSGTEVLTVGPEHADLTTLMDPRTVPAAIAMGQRQAHADTERIRRFWYGG